MHRYIKILFTLILLFLVFQNLKKEVCLEKRSQNIKAPKVLSQNSCIHGEVDKREKEEDGFSISHFKIGEKNFDFSQLVRDPKTILL